MASPIYTSDEARDRETFLALMWALSYPGDLRHLPIQTDNPMVSIGRSLLDLETSFYTPDADLVAEFGRTGARALQPDEAAYHFYPTFQPAALDTIAQARIGTMLRPDESATLVIGCAFASGGVFRWKGPGIHGLHEVRLGGIPARFWSLRSQMLRFPLGWDVFFIDGGQVVGLPRTTFVERIG
jgi:alpha-D-ribose 1-methylphosphonate 5-triphosphate synthase subunit PhnH